MLNSELIIISGLDQNLPVDSLELEQRVEEIITQAIEEKDAWKALNVCKTMIEIQQLSGIGLAKALYLIKNNWSVFDLKETFEDVAFEYFGKHRFTVDRYLAVQEMHEGEFIPNEFRDDIKQMNIKSQIPIAKALEQGVEITDEQWKKLAQAPDFSTVSKIVREDIKGAEPRKGSLMLSLDNVGSIWCFYDGERYFVGSLEVDVDEEVVMKAIKRIIDNSGILRN
jgi:hypothetical protein